MAKKKKPTQQSARERIRQQQQELAARDQRMKVVFRSLIGVAVLAVAAVVAAIALNQGGGASATPANMTDDGIVLVGHDGGVEAEEQVEATAGHLPRVGVYVDFQCPHCLTFEQTNMPFLTDQVEAGNIALEMHPVALMDNASQGTQFSSRAANAAACVATHEPETFLDVTQNLFDLQQAATQGSVDDDVLTGAVTDAGAGSADTRACILDRAYDGWVREATDRALGNPDLAGPSGRFGTPTVLINGERFNGAQTPEGLAAALGLEG